MQADGNEFLSLLSKQLQLGDHIALMQVQQVGLQDHPKRWSDDMPVPSDPTFATSRDQKALVNEQGTVEIAGQSVSASKADDKVLHTDLLTTLYLAGEDLYLIFAIRAAYC